MNSSKRRAPRLLSPVLSQEQGSAFQAPQQQVWLEETAHSVLFLITGEHKAPTRGVTAALFYTRPSSTTQQDPGSAPLLLSQ